MVDLILDNRVKAYLLANINTIVAMLILIHCISAFVVWTHSGCCTRMPIIPAG